MLRIFSTLYRYRTSKLIKDQLNKNGIYKFFQKRIPTIRDIALHFPRQTSVSTWLKATYCLILPLSDRCATTICLICKTQDKKIGDCRPISAIAFLLLCSFYRYGLRYATLEVEIQSVIVPYHNYVHE